MFETIAEECRRWTTDLTFEVALVLPIGSAGCGPAVAVERGGPTSVRLAPDRVLRLALACGVTEFAVAHNHRRNSPPGGDDLAVTRRLVAAAAIIDLRLVAHLVVTPAGWYDCLDATLGFNAWRAGAAA